MTNNLTDMCRDLALLQASNEETSLEDVALETDYGPQPYTFRSHSDIVAAEIPPIQWDVEGLIEHGDGPVLIFGDADSYKSWIALQIAACIASGQSLFGHFKVPKPRPAIYLNFDAGKSAFDRRAKRLDGPIPNLFIESYDAFDMDRLAATLECNRGSFLVMDCFADMYEPTPGVEQGVDMRRYCKVIRRLFEKHDCNGIIVDHGRRPRAGERSSTVAYYGSVQKKATFRQMWRIEPTRFSSDVSPTARVAVHCVRIAEAEKFSPFYVDFEWGATTFSANFGGSVLTRNTNVEVAAKNQARVRDLLLEHPDGIKTPEIAATIGLSEDEVRKHLKTLRAERRGNGKATRWALLATEGSGEDVFVED